MKRQVKSQRSKVKCAPGTDGVRYHAHLPHGIRYKSILRDSKALVVPAYKRVDARIGYRLRANVEIGVAGQDLQGGIHVEFVSVGPYSRASIRRSVFLKLVVGFWHQHSPKRQRGDGFPARLVPALTLGAGNSATYPKTRQE